MFLVRCHIEALLKKMDTDVHNVGKQLFEAFYLKTQDVNKNGFASIP
jgi:hypothetical protein